MLLSFDKPSASSIEKLQTLHASRDFSEFGHMDENVERMEFSAVLWQVHTRARARANTYTHTHKQTHTTRNTANVFMNTQPMGWEILPQRILLRTHNHTRVGEWVGGCEVVTVRRV